MSVASLSEYALFVLIVVVLVKPVGGFLQVVALGPIIEQQRL